MIQYVMPMAFADNDDHLHERISKKDLFPVRTEPWLRDCLKAIPKAVVLWTALSAAHLATVIFLTRTDPGSNWKYFCLCEFVLGAYAWLTCSLQIRNHLGRLMPTLLLPLVLLVAEFVNSPHYLRMSFHAAVFHYGTIGMAWTIFCAFGDRRWRVVTWLKNLIECCVVAIAFLLISNRLVSGAGITYDAVIAVCQTNLKEGWHYFWEENGGPVLIPVVIIGLAGLAYLKAFLMRRLKITTPSAGIFLSLFFLVMTIALCAAGRVANMYAFFSPELWTIAKAPSDYAHDVRLYQKIRESRAEAVDLALKRLELDDFQNIPDGIYVILVGESLDRHMMGCYDPSRRTTPFQSRLREAGSAVFFDCAYASHVQTVRAVPAAVCAYNQYWPSNDRQFGEISLLDVAHKLGFKTVWLSNQDRVSTATSPISVIAENADVVRFLKDSCGEFWDEELVTTLQGIDLGSRALVIVHLAGNHFPYAATFPPEFRFPAGLSVYEKSVYYNDFVISRFLDSLKGSAAAVLSFSDHADAVLAGRKHDPRPEKFDREMVDIPYWIWFSDSYRIAHKGLLESLAANSSYPITNDLTYDLMLAIMGIEAKGRAGRYSPTSREYLLAEEAPRTLGGLLTVPNPTDPNAIDR